MKTFEAKGTFYHKKDWKRFSKRVQAEKEPRAREKLLSLMGSQHGVKRHHIKVEALKEVTTKK